MRTSLCILLAVLSVILGFMAPIASAQTETWVGSTPANTLWSRNLNWLDGTYPAGGGDIFILDPDPTALCTFDLTTAISFHDLNLGGDSPTQMKLHVRDASMSTGRLFAMTDYGYLDADKDFTAGSSDLSGHLWFEVSSTATVTLTSAFIVGSAPSSPYISCGAELVLGTVTANNLFIWVNTDGAASPRGLKITSAVTGTKLKVEEELEILCINGDKEARMKLWVHSGTLDLTTAHLDVHGGLMDTTRADLDFDQNVSAEQSTFVDYVGIDVASGKTFAAGRPLTFSKGAYVRKTGAGTFKSGN